MKILLLRLGYRILLDLAARFSMWARSVQDRLMEAENA